MLQVCPLSDDQSTCSKPGSLSDDQRKDDWPDETDLGTKLWGTADNDRLTTRFTTSVGLQV